MVTTGKDNLSPSRELQRQILKRFLQITAGRLARIRLDLDKSQQLFLTGLPVLLNSRHQSSPCFDSEHTPCGISKYKPSAGDIQKMQRIMPQLQIPQEKAEAADILGLYISADSGTIARAEQPNMTVWLCHRENLGTNELTLLHRKCGSIAGWGKNLGLNIDFRIFDPDFIFRNTNSDVSLFRQDNKAHFLDLDRFYRTAVLLAGLMPLWWFIPPSEEHRYKQYASILRHKNYVSDEDVIDFDNIAGIPPTELIHQGIALLSQPDFSPCGRYLQLLHIEAAIQSFPQTPLLSQAFKEAIYAEQPDLDAIDPEMMAYQQLENYLLTGNDAQRLQMVRQCFYLRSRLQLSAGSEASHNHWQTKLMQKLCAGWQWSAGQITQLDQYVQQNLQQIRAEDSELRRAFSNSYRQLASFASQQLADNSDYLPTLDILGKQLFAELENRAGKITLLNPKLVQNLSYDQLYLDADDINGHLVWSLYAGAARQEMLQQSEILSDILAWCHVNDLLHSSSEIILTNSDSISPGDLLFLRETIQASLNRKLLRPAAAAFRQAPVPVKMLMFVNLSRPADSISSTGLTNTLSGPQGKDVVIHHIECLSINSWGEIICKRFDGTVALFNCINDYLQNVPPGQLRQLPELRISSFGPNAEACSKRLQQLFHDINACYHTGLYPANARFILQMKKQFFIIQYLHNKAQFKGAHNYENLLKRLGEKQEHYSPIVFERHTLPTSNLAAACITMRPNTVQVYLSVNTEKQADFLIIDERGSLFSYQQEMFNARNLLQSLDTFLQSALYRQSTTSSFHNHSQFIDMDVLYYQMLPDQNGLPRVEGFALHDHLSAQHAFSIQAIAVNGSDNKLLFNIFCDEQEFSAVDWGNELYSSVARFILARRKSGARYPCHISDLDLTTLNSQLRGLQTLDYLRLKQEVEDGINTALQRV